MSLSTLGLHGRRLTVLVATFALLLLLALPAAASETVDIDLTDDGFEPAEIDIAAGDTVRWTNTTDEEWTIVGEDGTWDSGPLEPDATFSVTLRREGTVVYGTAEGEFVGEVVISAEDEVVEDDDEVDEADEADENGEPAAMPRTGVPALLLGLAVLGLLASGGTFVGLSSRLRGR